ncbi:MAG: hypothetical protein AB7O97_17655 [Planctomycetota bacterium]
MVPSDSAPGDDGAHRGGGISGGARAAGPALLGCAALVGLFSVLVPWGSYPVGFDVFRSLLIAWTWANEGFPQLLPMAGHTGLDVHFADQQLGLDALLRVLGGRAVGPGLVPPLLWGLVAVQGLALWWAVRLLRPDASAWWILLLPLVSQAWMFRCTTLRAMLLAVPLLVLLLAVTTARARGAAVRPWPLAVCTGLFAYCHGAVEVPVLLWALGAAGARFEGGRLPWRDGAWVLGGLLVAAFARPDFPHNLWLWNVLNLGLLRAKLDPSMQVLPSELQPLAVSDLLATEWTFLLAAALAVVLSLRAGQRGRPAWSALLPVLLLVLAAVLSRRMLEMAAPAVLWAIAVHWRWRLPVGVAVAGFAAACWVHAPLASAGAEVNRVHELQTIGEWLAGRARLGDRVFVTDWGASSPLAWHTRARRLRFSGAVDPVYMWAHDPALWAEWQDVKLARAEDPLRIVRDRFGARFLVFAVADAAAGAAPGTTANALRRALGAAAERGVTFAWHHVYVDDPDHPRDWIAVDFGPG